jgi:hypothetical protein
MYKLIYSALFWWLLWWLCKSMEEYDRRKLRANGTNEIQ